MPGDAPPVAASAPVEQEGLRARKRRQLRQRLSDAATGMFLERGFDAVRVSEVAVACEVSEKTVFNHFASKEALVMDRLDGVSAALRDALGAPGRSAVDAVLHVLDDELDRFGERLAPPPPADVRARVRQYRRFGDLIRSTPSLQDHQARTGERIVTEVAQALVARSPSPSPGEAVTAGSGRDPAVLLAAIVLVGLWRVQFDSLRHHLEHLDDRADRDLGRADVVQALDRVRDDVTRAALVARAALRPLEQG